MKNRKWLTSVAMWVLGVVAIVVIALLSADPDLEPLSARSVSSTLPQ